MQHEKELFIKCECGAHVLRVAHEYEIYDETNAVTSAPRVRQEFDLAMFTYGNYGQKLTLKDKFKLIWKLITKGRFWEDCLILNEDEAKKLADFIDKNVIQTEKEK